ncbi:hypothetical protein KPZU09_42990 [Klebsiella pneumoniae]|uniref:(R)-2-hydroxyglutaryl-CoA dehydratase activator n=1 Tax=Klebsiella pneumoniae TaxID=573 RepID=A0A919HW79_KLEPN|nr:hypothetical protein KPZU09_42990 [Klebsiella pneumoniae]
MNYTVGIDSGSTATKGILLADGVIVRRFSAPHFRPDAIHEARETLRAGLTETPFYPHRLWPPAGGFCR